jgi:purine-binding chemotaxis protein CheW
MTQLATFHLGTGLYGVDVQRVREVVRRQQTTTVPLAPPAVAGLINLRGQVVTTVDLRERLDLPPAPPQEDPMLVVVLVDGESIALLVDRIGGVIDVSEENFEPPPDTLTGPVRDVILGAYKLDQALLLRLDVDTAAAA